MSGAWPPPQPPFGAPSAEEPSHGRRRLWIAIAAGLTGVTVLAVAGAVVVPRLLDKSRDARQVVDARSTTFTTPPGSAVSPTVPGSSAGSSSACSQASPCLATVRTASGDSVSLRAGPSSSSAEQGEVPNGSTLRVVCRIGGESIRGPDGTSDQWDRTPGGSLVADAFVDVAGSPGPCGGGSSGVGEPTASAPTLGIVWAPNQQGYGTARPGTVFNGGSPAGMVRGISWSSWGGPTAEGTGEALWLGPGDIVATADFESARVRAFDLGPCAGETRYRRVTWWFPQHGQSFDPAINDFDLCRKGG